MGGTMPNNTPQQGNEHTPWSQIDMQSQEVQDDLGRWSQFGMPDGGDATQQENPFQSEWATADDLVNSIVGATTGGVPQQAVVPEGDPQPDDVAPDRDPRPHGRPSSGEYGAWEPRNVPEQGDQPLRRMPRRQGADDTGESWPCHHEVRGGNRFDADDKAGRKGRFTSAIALVLAIVTAFVAISPLTSRLLQEEKWVLTLLSSLPIATMVAFPAIILGLRSATKPKGQVGKRRGVAAIVISSVSLVVSAVIVTSTCVGMFRQANEEKTIAQDQTSSTTTSIVFPGGQVTLENKAIKVLMRVGLMPDNTLDDGEIRISSSNGKIYIGSKEIDPELVMSSSDEDNMSEASEDTYKSLVESIATLNSHGVAITTDGKTITLKDRTGNSRTLTPEEIVDAGQQQ